MGQREDVTTSFPASGTDAVVDLRDPAPADAPAARRRRPGAHERQLFAALTVALLGLVTLLGGWWLLAMILAFALTLAVHEAGHFLVARRAGMAVSEAFLGFGPVLWSTRRRGTRYGIKAIPAGAYVRIVGMTAAEDVGRVPEQATYRAQPYRWRLATVLAGPAANLLFAFVLVVVTAMAFTTPRPEAWSVRITGDGPAAQAGLVDGDRVTAVDGRPVATWTEFVSAVQMAGPGRLALDVRHDGRPDRWVTFDVGWALSSATASHLPGLRTGDRPVAVAGQPVDDWPAFQRAMVGAVGPDVGVTVERNGSELTIPVPTPARVDGAPDLSAGLVGSTASARLGPVAAVHEGAASLWRVGGQTVDSITGFFAPSNLWRFAGNVADPAQARADVAATQATVDGSDPGTVRFISVLGIVRLGAQAGEAGTQWFLALLAVINVALAIGNLLPLLPFDGGHAVVATYEAVRGRTGRPGHRVDTRRLAPISYAVVAVFVLIGLACIWLDTVAPAANPFAG